ncbi:MAG: LysM peptidoglycan-binding domain-containing M23 family metallopeptidase [Thermovirgaceae bacterium]|nr:LysM peptidoglycan-binding domain-containing M23 family metallopeptidase [Thermovirgaceae bacterium]
MKRFPGKKRTMLLSGRIGFWTAILTMLSAALFLTTCAFFTSGISAPELMGDAGKASAVSDMPSGFIVVDISHSLASEVASPGAVALGIGPIPEGPSLFDDNFVLEAPASDEPEVPEAPKEWADYYVKPGETLSDIAASFGIPAKIIQDANHLDNPDLLSEGQELLIPVNSGAVKAVAAEIQRRSAEDIASRPADMPIGVEQYTVRDGDSLWSIANSFNLDINTLFGCNTMKDPNYLRVGSVLRIPNQDGIFYAVKKGDTLDGIAKKHGTQAESVMSANGLVSKSLKAGAELFLPGAKPVTTVYALLGDPSFKGTQKLSKSFDWPLVGGINSGYGWRRHPFTKRREFHTGIDIKGPTGRTIRAAKAGRVVYSGWMGGYGRVVVIDHGKGYTTLYAHCSSLLVSQGQRVSTGQPVGKVGSSGMSTGAHLHFEVRLNNKPLNPLQVLK